MMKFLFPSDEAEDVEYRDREMLEKREALPIPESERFLRKMATDLETLDKREEQHEKSAICWAL
jgi:hypothetical protein